ncbi:MAG: ketoacyl-ACP synthase III [Chloroflexi bacterium]|nr:ketoacyl-ACP synthase III [Chloroflexota bacterium]
MGRYAHITGWGKYLPQRILTNTELAKSVDTTDEWIRERTGIGERRIASAKETTAMMAIHAAREAIEVADLDPQKIDLIIVATATPEYTFPATACLVQDALGASRAGAFDLSAGCSGFGYALATAASWIRSGMHNTVLVIGSETLSQFLDWEDRATCVLFGDGAGAVLLQGKDQPGGVLATVLGSDGSGGELLIIPGGGSKHPASAETIATKLHVIKMNGREVYRFATRVIAHAAREVTKQAGWTIEKVDLLIPHQANVRILDSAAKALKLSPEKIFANLEHYGNTSAASIPIALCEAIDADRVKPGDRVVMVAFGAGLTWAACAVEWSAPKHRAAPVQVALSRVRYGFFGLRSLLARLLRRIDALFSWLIDRIEGKRGGE